jgi:hypothetical protein
MNKLRHQLGHAASKVVIWGRDAAQVMLQATAQQKRQAG